MVKMILVDNFGGDIRAYNSAEGAVFSIQIG
jgi:hypothetical protein